MKNAQTNMGPRVDGPIGPAAELAMTGSRYDHVDQAYVPPMKGQIAPGDPGDIRANQDTDTVKHWELSGIGVAGPWTHKPIQTSPGHQPGTAYGYGAAQYGSQQLQPQALVPPGQAPKTKGEKKRPDALLGASLGSDGGQNQN